VGSGESVQLRMRPLSLSVLGGGDERAGHLERAREQSGQPPTRGDQLAHSTGVENTVRSLGYATFCPDMHPLLELVDLYN
jgi:hypothetical protein